MEHNISLITTIAAGFGMALILGFVAERCKLPALVGYLLAGIIIGPSTPGYVADVNIASQLSEIGVMLLMFGVGLHFSLDDLLAVKRIAIPGAVVQMTVATLLGMGVAMLWGWSWGAALVFGLCLSCASTVVLLKALEARGVLESMNGRIAVGWLVVEDLATVLVLVLLPPLAGVLGGAVSVVGPELAGGDGGSIGYAIGKTLLLVAAFIALMLIVGRRVLPWMLWQVARTGSRELFTLAVIAAAIGIAYGATHYFNVSFALGAFFAGMVMRESEFSHRAAEESLPLRDAFSVLFFVSVGMLFNPWSLMSGAWPILATLFIIVVGKSLAAFLIVVAFRYPTGTALTISASLAQIGEFSFILAELGVGLKLLPEQGRDLILAGAILSIMLNPAVFAGVGWIKRRLDQGAATSPPAAATSPDAPVAPPPPPDADEESPQATSLTDHTILVGYGRVGSLVGQALREKALPFLVIEDAARPQGRLREDGVETISGNGVRNEILGSANVAGARRLIVAIPNAFEAGQIVETAKAANPQLTIIARAHSDAEVDHLTNLGAGTVIMGEREIARGIIDAVTGVTSASQPGAPTAHASPFEPLDPAPPAPPSDGADKARDGSHI